MTKGEATQATLIDHPSTLPFNLTTHLLSVMENYFEEECQGKNTKNFRVEKYKNEISVFNLSFNVNQFPCECQNKIFSFGKGSTD